MVGWSPVHISKPTLEYEDVVRKVHVDSAAQQYTAAVVEKMRIALNGDCSPLKIFEHLASEGIEVMLKYIRSGMEIANRKARAAGGGTVLYVFERLLSRTCLSGALLWLVRGVMVRYFLSA